MEKVFSELTPNDEHVRLAAIGVRADSGEGNDAY
jgi:hypothetical protein